MKAPNALTIAFRAIYGQDPPVKQEGKTGAPKRIWRGLEVDASIRNEWLEALNEIEGIFIVSTEEGENEYRPAHIVFNFSNPEKDKSAKKVSEILNTFIGVYSLCDIGNNRRPRIVVSGDVRSASEAARARKEWTTWWSKIAGIIIIAIKTVEIRNIQKIT